MACWFIKRLLFNTPPRLVNSYCVTESCQLLWCQRLGQHIRYHLIGWAVADVDEIVFVQLADKVVFCVHMLRTVVDLR